MSFDVAANDEFLLHLGGVTEHFHIAPHPAAASFVHAMEGGKATVYRLLSDSETDSSGAPRQYALKVMKPVYSVPELANITQNLGRLKALPGLRVCDRRSLTPQSAAATLRKYPELAYSTIMPWIEGKSWFECLLELKDGSFALSKDQSVRLAQNFCAVLGQLERGGLAHCDLSAGNVMLDPATFTLDMVDVEDMFAPGFQPPSALPAGTPGYQHRSSAGGQWSATADRFAAAILLSEMLVLHDPATVRAASLESYFEPGELQTSGSQRYAVMRNAITAYSGRLADLLDRAWQSNTLEECPRIEDWEHALISRHIQFVPLPAPEAVPEPTPSWSPLRIEEQPPTVRFSGPLQPEPSAQPIIRWEK